MNNNLISNLSNEERERLINSITRLTEAYSNINQDAIKHLIEITKKFKPVNIKISELSQISIEHKNLINAISKSLSPVQNIRFQDYISEITEDVNDFGNNKPYNEKYHQNLIQNIQIDKVNIEIHNNNYPPNKNNLFTILTNLLSILQVLQIINAPEETIKTVVEFIKKILNLIT